MTDRKRKAGEKAQHLAADQADVMLRTIDAPPAEKRRRVKALVEEPKFATEARRKNPKSSDSA